MIAGYEVYQRDSHEIRFLSAERIADAFLTCEQRKVDKGGCISFDGRKYEVELGLSMIYKTVEVVYDPADISKLTIECDGFPPCEARPLVIRSHAARRPELPERFEKKEPTGSRVLKAAEKQNELRERNRKTAISFYGLNGGDSDV